MSSVVLVGLTLQFCSTAARSRLPRQTNDHGVSRPGAIELRSTVTNPMPKAGSDARGERVCEAGELGLEVEVLADAATVEEHVEGASALGVGAVGRWRAD
jgi:hypothetical protein